MNEISEWDTNHFGFKIARISIFNDISSMLKCLKKSGVRLVIARVEASQYESVRNIMREGFEFITTEVHYKRNIRNVHIADKDPRVLISRLEGCHELDTLLQITRESFTDYMNHYWLDSKLDRGACSDVYIEWLKNSCSEETNDTVFVGAVQDMGILGYMTAHKISDTGAEILLGAVSPRAQILRAEIYKCLMIALMEYFRKQGLKFIQVSTQLHNYTVQRIWTESGFRMYKSEYTFHKWLDSA